MGCHVVNNSFVDFAIKRLPYRRAGEGGSDEGFGDSVKN